MDARWVERPEQTQPCQCVLPQRVNVTSRGVGDGGGGLFVRFGCSGGYIQNSSFRFIRAADSARLSVYKRDVVKCQSVLRGQGWLMEGFRLKRQLNSK